MPINYSSEYAEPEIRKGLISALRAKFAEVFARHYAPKLVKPESKAGFQDLIDKYFEGEPEKYTLDERVAKLQDIYSKGGFDDEAAFLQVWGDMPAEASAEAWLSEKEKDLSPGDLEECRNYLILLGNERRRLKHADFNFSREGEVIVAFTIFHIFNEAMAEGSEKEIVHVRQGVSYPPKMGFLTALILDLAGRYPKALVECNRRQANDSISALTESGFFKRSTPVLGYPSKYYESFKSELSLGELASALMKAASAKTLHTSMPAVGEEDIDASESRLTLYRK